MANLNDLPQTPESPRDYGPGPQGPTAGPPPLEPPTREPDKDARLWAMFAHLAGLAFLLPVVPIVGGVIGPLIIWLIKKEQYPFVDDQGKEALNFQITMLIYGVAAGLLMMVCVGFILLPAVIIADIVLVVLAAIKANDGIRYRYPYPLIIRFIK